MNSQTSGDMFYIGSTSLTGSYSDCARVQVFKCQHSMASGYLADSASTDTGIYDLLTVASLTFHELDCQNKEDMRSVMLDRLGTLFLSTSRTVHCLCLTSGKSSNISLTSTCRPNTHPIAHRARSMPY